MKVSIASLDNPTDPLIIKPSESIPDVPPAPDYALSAVGDMQQACDTIVFKMGNRIIGQVLEIGPSEIKYRDCDNPSGPAIAVLLSDVYVIKHPNGTRDYFHAESPNVSQQNSYTSGQDYKARLKTEGLGLAGFIAGITGLFIFGFPLGALAIVFGIISLGKIKRHPDRYKGKGLATASLILGLVGVIGLAILLATM